MQYWTSADIARELGVKMQVVYNWTYYGSDYALPHAAETRNGIKLWTDEHAQEMIGAYRARKATRAPRLTRTERAEANAREARMLELLVNRG